MLVEDTDTANTKEGPSKRQGSIPYHQGPEPNTLTKSIISRSRQVTISEEQVTAD